MVEIKHKSKAVKETLVAGDLINNKVYSNDGIYLGRVRDLHINPDKFSIEGIHIGKGLFSRYAYIGRDYIGKMSRKGVVLSITPLTELVNKKVLDSNGKVVGRVRVIYRNKKTNTLRSMVVERGVFKKNLLVNRNMISDIGEKIVLKKPI